MNHRVLLGVGCLLLSSPVMAEPYRTDDLVLRERGLRFTVKASRSSHARCGYQCLQDLRYLSPNQLQCLHDQVKEVRHLFDDVRNASVLKKNGIKEVRVYLTDNSRNTLPQEDRHAEQSGFLLPWILQVNSTILSTGRCHVTSTGTLADLLKHRVESEIALEKMLADARDVLKIIGQAPERVSEAGVKSLPGPLEQKVPLAPELASESKGEAGKNDSASGLAE